MSKGLLWAVILTLVYFIILPFPLSFIACVITGAVIPWVTGNKQEQNKSDKDM